MFKSDLLRVGQQSLLVITRALKSTITAYITYHRDIEIRILCNQSQKMMISSFTNYMYMYFFPYRTLFVLSQYYKEQSRHFSEKHASHQHIEKIIRKLLGGNYCAKMNCTYAFSTTSLYAGKFSNSSNHLWPKSKGSIISPSILKISKFIQG